MNIALKAASLLLSYPTAELQAAIPELIEVIETDTADRKVKKSTAKYLIKLAKDIGDLDLYDAQERYVYLFDRTRTLSLHLFEHVHGESRDRGQAMVDLGQMYDEAGMAINSREMPDYLPLFLEFLSISPAVEVSDLLGQINHIIVVLKARLNKRDSVYGNAFAALEKLASAKPEKEIVDEMLAQKDDDPDDLEALDKIWEEDPVTFGGNLGDQTCGLDRIRVQARAMNRKPADIAESRPTTEG